MAGSCSLRLVVAALLLLVGCRSQASAGPERVELVVFAASSLTEAFAELEDAFERSHPGVDLLANHAGSQILRVQIEQGAAADLFASANHRHVQALVEGGHADAGRTFAGNELVVIVPRDNPAGIEAFAELDRAERIVVGTPEVPVGVYAAEVLDRARARARLGEDWVARVWARVVSRESNVRLVRTKVELGEADAALVYRTDAVASTRVRSVAIPAALNVRARYVIASLSSARHPEHAAAFVEFLLSEAGRAVLRRHGFSVEGEGREP